MNQERSETNNPATAALYWRTPRNDWVEYLYAADGESLAMTKLCHWSFRFVRFVQLIARMFFIAGATFGAMGFYGQTAQTDLSKFGSFLTMGLIGLVIASIVNIFGASSALQFALSAVGVIVFVGLTAWTRSGSRRCMPSKTTKRRLWALSRSIAISSTCS